MEGTTRNAETAKNGFKAEQNMCENNDVRQKLEQYFQKSIAVMQVIPGRKKSDIVVLFTDGSQTRIQNKHGPGGHRGWSVDRRAILKMPLDDSGKQLLEIVCLRKGGERPVANRPVDMIRDLFMGTNPEYMPDYFTHSIFERETGQLLHLSIAPAEKVLDALNASAYPQFLPKRTCVYVSDTLYLQRKGSSRKDLYPDDIQLKLISLPASVMETI
jgi:hypothetical protein